MSLVKLSIKGISYSQTQNGAYALILNEVDGERNYQLSSVLLKRNQLLLLWKEIKPPVP
jgi:hypothetical protein